MKTRVVSLNKDKEYMEIDLINSNGVACYIRVRLNPSCSVE